MCNRSFVQPTPAQRGYHLHIWTQSQRVMSCQKYDCKLISTLFTETHQVTPPFSALVSHMIVPRNTWVQVYEYGRSRFQPPLSVDSFTAEYTIGEITADSPTPRRVRVAFAWIPSSSQRLFET